MAAVVCPQAGRGRRRCRWLRATVPCIASAVEYAAPTSPATSLGSVLCTTTCSATCAVRSRPIFASQCAYHHSFVRVCPRQGLRQLGHLNLGIRTSAQAGCRRCFYTAPQRMQPYHVSWMLSTPNAVEQGGHQSGPGTIGWALHSHLVLSMVFEHSFVSI